MKTFSKFPSSNEADGKDAPKKQENGSDVKGNRSVKPY